MRVILLSVCALLAAAQSTARIEGRVVSQSGEPVRKAEVRLQVARPEGGGPAMSYRETTDTAGKFAAEKLVAGLYQIFVTKTGFAPMTQQFQTVMLRAGEAKTDLEIKLLQLGFISGQVTDQDGDPVFGANIQAMLATYNGGRRQLVYNGAVTSDDQGSFRILNLPPGRYYPMAVNTRLQNGSSSERRGRSAQEDNITTFYPSAAEFSGAVAVEVGSGAEVRSFNIRMIRTRTFSISGKAVDSKTGAPVAVQLLLTKKGAEYGLPIGRISGFSRQNGGLFEFHGLDPGTYVLKGRPMTSGDSPNSSVANLSGRAEITVSNSDVDGFTFGLSAPPEITGRVRVEEGDLRDILPGPVPATSGGRNIALVDLEDGIGGSPSGLVEIGGTFKIPNAAWSRYVVTPVGFSGNNLYIKSMRFGGQDVIKNPMDLTSGVGGILEILYSHKAAEVDATVHDKDGKIATGVSVSIWPKTPVAFDALRGSVFRAQQNGAQITGVPPGEYYVAAWEEVDRGLTMYPEFLARFTSQAANVKVGESDKVSVDLTLISRDKIAAEVAKLP